MSERESERLLRSYYERRLAELGGRPGRSDGSDCSAEGWRDRGTTRRTEGAPRLTVLVAAGALAAMAAMVVAWPSASLEERREARFANGIAAAISIEVEGSAFAEALVAASATWPRRR